MSMISLLIGLAIISAAMVPLEVVFPGVTGQRRLRRGWLLDAIYWFFTALVTKPIARTAVSWPKQLLNTHARLGHGNCFAEAP